MSRVAVDMEICANTECGEEFVPLSDDQAMCGICTQAEIDRAAIERAVAEGASIESRLQALGVNVRRHGHMELDEMGPDAEPADSFVQDVIGAGRWDYVQGLYLSGPTGTGKTQMAVATIRSLLEAGYGGRIVFDRSRALVTTVQDRYGTGTVDPVTDERRKADLWVLDDIGTEKPTADAFRILEDILDAREGHPTILTSNRRPGELAEAWADADSVGRFRSRIGPQNYREVQLTGKDRRFVA